MFRLQLRRSHAPASPKHSGVNGVVCPPGTPPRGLPDADSPLSRERDQRRFWNRLVDRGIAQAMVDESIAAICSDPPVPHPAKKVIERIRIGAVLARLEMPANPDLRDLAVAAGTQASILEGLALDPALAESADRVKALDPRRVVAKAVAAA